MAVILPNAPGVVRFVHKGTHQDSPFVNTFHVLGSVGQYSQANMQALATAGHNAYFNAFIPQFNTGTHLVSTTAIDLTSRTAYWGVDTTDHPGTSVGTVDTPLSVAYCISWSIHDRYRGGHPRMYLPAAHNSEILQGRYISQAKRDLLDAAAEGYLTAMAAITTGGQTFQPVCVRYYAHKLLQDPPLIRPIYDSAIHSRIDSMRRRTGPEAA